MLQEDVFKALLNVILISAQLFGFWPYVLESNERLFKPSKLYYIYSVGLMIGINVAYFVYFQNLYIFFLYVFKSEGARITIMYGVTCISLISISIYVIQLVKLNRLNAIFVKSKCLMQKLNQTIEMENVSYTKELLHFTTKTFVIGSLHIYLSLIKLKHDIKSMIFGYIIPDLMVTIMANIFYGSMLITFVYLKQTNQNMHNVTAVAAELQGSDKTNLEKLETFCRLSDRLNELGACQYDICDLIRDLYGTFSFHVNAWIIHKVCMTLILLFLIYVLIVMLLFQPGERHYTTVTISVVQVSITFGEIFFLCKACNDVKNEIQKTSHILHNKNIISSKSDERYVKSLEMLALQTMQFRSNMSICGIFNIDYTMIYSIITFLLATWLILIQFEMTELHKTSKH